jgi:RNA polymerase sigma-70 factor (ECF subfamily)
LQLTGVLHGMVRQQRVITTLVSDVQASSKTEILEQLMRDYGTRVMHLAYFYVKDRYLAEDIAQEVFIKAYRNLDSFRGDSSAYTWLYRITVNACRDKTRSAWWRRLVPTDDQRVLADGMVSGEPAPEEAALGTLDREELMDVVMKLPEHYREVVVLFYYEDMSTAQIAEVTGQNESTVKTRLFRARQQLKALLEQKGGALA